MASRPGGPANANRGKIIDAFMELLARQRIEDIGFGAIARRTGLSLADCRAAFPSVLAVLAAYTQKIDHQVLAGGDPDTAEEPPRERLFDVLMRRLEALAPHKAAIRSLARSAMRDPALAGVTGRYFNGERAAEPLPQAKDPEARRRLRDVSDQLTGAPT